MKFKKILLGSLIVTATSLTTGVQADGFFSKLFASDSNKADFKSMLLHVPADTSYMFANKKSIPDDVMDFHMKRSQEMFKMISKMQYKAKKSDDNKGDKSEADSKGQAFFKAVMGELGSKLEEDKFEETGLSLTARSLIYGYQQMPVMRMSISDKEKIMELLKRAEEESDYKLKFDKCGEFECFKGSAEKDAPEMVLVILKDQLAMSLFPKEKSAEMIDHLIGKAAPKESYTEDKWDAFLKENGYKGFGDGFVNLKSLYEANKTSISEGFFKVNKSSKTALSKEQIANCTLVVDDHVNNMPEIIFGTKNLKKNLMDYEMVFKTSTGVSDVLQSLANKTNISKRSVNPIFDMGFNLDFKKTSAAMTTYSNFLIESAEKHKCESIKPKDIRKSMGGMMMVMNMGLSQFKSLYFAINDLEMNDKMQPEKIEAIFSIGSDDPASLIAMAGMFAPPLAELKIPEDGTPVELPANAIPSRGLPVPPLFISRSKDSINIMVGNDKPDLKDYKSEVPELMSFAVDGKRYYEIITKVMKVAQKSKSASAKDDGIFEMMETMGSMSGKVQQEITADKRGLVVNYHIQY